jgi:FtsP/CotA-like multicopper oxidase with cupredoxin domain
MFKKVMKATSYSKQERDIARYMKEVRDIQDAKLSRRELFKMGLTAGVGGLAAIGGKNFLPNLAQAKLGVEDVADAPMVISPLCTMPWSDPLPIPKTPVSVGAFQGPQAEKARCQEKHTRWHPGKGALGDDEDFTEARTDEHQRFEEFGGIDACTKYEMMAKEFDWNFYSDSDGRGLTSKVWTYADMNSDAVGVLRFKAHYGKPIMMRMYNGLPKQDANGMGGDNQGFGINQISPHLHNAHNPPESDGGPLRFWDSGQWYDFWYPNVRAGFASTHKDGTYYNGNWCPGNWQETQSTLWFHDHRFDFTASNVYKGLASFYTLFSDDIGLDTDDESTGLRLPSGEYDIPLLFADKVFDQGGQLFFDTFNIEGIVGDQQTVNFKIKPYLEVKRRKYRFRLLDAGPSRFYEFFLSDGSMMTRIANCGNLLPKAQVVPSIRMGVAERADIIIDFSQYAPGTEIYLENRLEQLNGKGPTGAILPSSEQTQLLKFIVTDAAFDDATASLETLQNQVMVPMPDMAANPVVQKRTFSFDTKNGAWTVNGEFFSPSKISAYIVEGTAEEWEFTSGGGWSHPVHIHHEEFQILTREGGAPALDDLSRKDVVRIGKAAQGIDNTGSVTFYMQFRDWVGDYPMHCHNVVHEDHAMMVRWKIVNADGSEGPKPNTDGWPRASSGTSATPNSGTPPVSEQGVSSLHKPYKKRKLKKRVRRTHWSKRFRNLSDKIRNILARWFR